MEGYGLPECLRVTIGTEQENRDVIRVLSDFMRDGGPDGENV